MAKQKPASKLLQAAESFEVPRSGKKTWAEKLKRESPEDFEGLLEIARDFKAEGKWRKKFVSIRNFYSFFVSHFGPVCKPNTFQIWLQNLDCNGVE